MRWCVPILLLLSPCFAQPAARKGPAPKPAAPATQSWPLVSLKVTGNQISSTAQILALTGLRVGQPVTKADFDAARAKLSDSGAFESVGFQFGPAADGKGYSGVVEVVEVQQLYPYRLEDLPAGDRQLRAFLAEREPLFHDKIPATKEVIDRMAAELTAYPGNAGLKDTVTARVVADKPGELSVLFRPGTAPPAIAEVEFSGMKDVPAGRLQQALSAVVIGVPYREAALRQLLDTSIRPVYDGRGHLKVSFPRVEAVPAKDVDGVRVKIEVEEGPVYKLASVKSAVPELSAKQVLKMADLKVGEIANFDAVAVAIDRIQKELRKDGYMRSRTTTERVVHDAEKTVDITFTSELGPQFLMGKLTVQGLDVTTEPAIRKLWSMTPGKPFNADYPQMFLDRVKEDGYFDYLLDTRFDQTVNEKNSTVDIVLYFKGGRDLKKEKEEERRKREEPPPFGIALEERGEAAIFKKSR